MLDMTVEIDTCNDTVLDETDMEVDIDADDDMVAIGNGLLRVGMVSGLCEVSRIISNEVIAPSR